MRHLAGGETEKKEREREIEKERHNTHKREDMTHIQALSNILYSVGSSVYVLVWSAQVVAHTERS